eukprot:CAMPEP_0181250836 /NCGR_PEP_ID=MMETSP1096-20121128/46534_1 /TAXON_ID=156174 ORGANISM="Chrysochromulina ericina, Strain CCMP281" /NCGR_SAMPLE_ID=MMETSP1096 /ASSEMBLY_ACC=CAM_ASM_000453 /LENGTH=80 /DNA_ID=CAMNT_0023348335 /DNA_START=80 /DNA_END=322 /DNA_ORIENTATION=-
MVLYTGQAGSATPHVALAARTSPPEYPPNRSSEAHVAHPLDPGVKSAVTCHSVTNAPQATNSFTLCVSPEPSSQTPQPFY